MNRRVVFSTQDVLDQSRDPPLIVSETPAPQVAEDVVWFHFEIRIIAARLGITDSDIKSRH